MKLGQDSSLSFFCDSNKNRLTEDLYMLMENSAGSVLTLDLSACIARSGPLKNMEERKYVEL